MAKIEYKTLNDRAYDEIKKGLIMGRFAPLQPLVIRALADAYGISATPIREALQRLVAERLLEVMPNRSIIVPAMTQAKFRELLRIRLALECMAAELAVAHFRPAHLRKLRSILDSIIVTAADGDARGYVVLNQKFHFEIYDRAGSPLLLQMIQDLWIQVGPVFNELFRDENFRAHANDAHEIIYAALERRDAAAVRGAVQQDLSHAADSLLRHLPENIGTELEKAES